MLQRTHKAGNLSQALEESMEFTSPLEAGGHDSLLAEVSHSSSKFELQKVPEFPALLTHASRPDDFFSTQAQSKSKPSDNSASDLPFPNESRRVQEHAQGNASDEESKAKKMWKDYKERLKKGSSKIENLKKQKEAQRQRARTEEHNSAKVRTESRPGGRTERNRLAEEFLSHMMPLTDSTDVD